MAGGQPLPKHQGPEVFIHRQDDASLGLSQCQQVFVGASTRVRPRPSDVVHALPQGLHQPPWHILVGKQARHWGQLRRLAE